MQRLHITSAAVILLAALAVPLVNAEVSTDPKVSMYTAIALNGDHCICHSKVETIEVTKIPQFQETSSEENRAVLIDQEAVQRGNRIIDVDEDDLTAQPQIGEVIKEVDIPVVSEDIVQRQEPEIVVHKAEPEGIIYRPESEVIVQRPEPTVVIHRPEKQNPKQEEPRIVDYQGHQNNGQGYACDDAYITMVQQNKNRPSVANFGHEVLRDEEPGRYVHYDQNRVSIVGRNSDRMVSYESPQPQDDGGDMRIVRNQYGDGSQANLGYRYHRYGKIVHSDESDKPAVVTVSGSIRGVAGVAAGSGSREWIRRPRRYEGRQGNRIVQYGSGDVVKRGGERGVLGEGAGFEFSNGVSGGFGVGYGEVEGSGASRGMNAVRGGSFGRSVAYGSRIQKGRQPWK